MVKKSYSPPFDPRVLSETDTRHFDACFTNQPYSPLSDPSFLSSTDLLSSFYFSKSVVQQGKNESNSSFVMITNMPPSPDDSPFVLLTADQCCLERDYRQL